MTRQRHLAAFLAPPADPFAEYHRMSAEWDRRQEQLARDHDAHMARIHERELEVRAQFEMECG